MKCPFPGMDPYLEAHWGDVHQSLITYARDQLQGRLPGDLRARVEERVFVEFPSGESRSLYSDVRVAERGHLRVASAESSAAVATAQPLLIDVGAEPITQGSIEIIDVRSGRRVVTVIEFLSPTNKVRGEGQDLYLRKQEEVRAAGVHLVEIDLTRAGRRNQIVPPERIPPSHRTTYQVCVWRATKPRRAAIYRVPLRGPLPAIAVPLREGDDDVTLELQSLIEQCYRNGRYDDTDYRSEPVPPLPSEDTAWADELLRSAGVL